MMNRYGPIVSTDETRTEDIEFAPGVRLRITNVPTVLRRGGWEPGVRIYYTIATARQLEHLRELARLRMAQGESDIELDFRDDASLGRASLNVRRRNERERDRKRYGDRMRRVPRFGTSDFYYERLHPAGRAVAEGQDVPG